MPQIVTITFNPCVDKTTTIPSLMPDKKLRCSPPTFEPGGGGLNVARAIKKLGGEAMAIYPAGGYSGKFLNILVEQEEIDYKAVEIKNHTRENLIVLDAASNRQYRFGMPGPTLFEEEWKECLQLIEQHNQVEFIVASGSLPKGVPLDVYGQIAALAKKINAKFVVDTSGEALKCAAKEGVYMLKPNLAELSSLVGKEEIHAEMVDDVAREIISSGGCEVMIVSLGPAGAMLITKDIVTQVVPPVVKQKSTVGAGDSMVAGVVLSISKGKSLKESLKYGVACGTAATMNPGTELCKPDDVEKLLKLIRVEF